MIKPTKFSKVDKDFRDAFLGKRVIEVKMCEEGHYNYFSGDRFVEPEGGLTFVLEDRHGRKETVILGYTELGSWIEFRGENKNDD